MKTVLKTGKDIANDPATCIALGSVFMAAANGGVEGAYLNAAATAVIAGLYVFSGVRSALLAWQKAHNTGPSNFSNDPQFYQGLGTLCAARMQAIPMIFSVMGIARTVWRDDHSKTDSKANGVRGFLKRHYTAARCYAAQYGISTATAAWSANTEQAIAFALWSWAFTRFDEKLNEEIFDGVRDRRLDF